MPKPVLVIHGAGTPPFQHGHVYWQALLTAALGPRYSVSSPLMPEPDEPRYHHWATGIAEGMAGSDPIVLVGHSLGASLLLKFLSEQTITRPLLGLFLVSTPHWGDPGGDMDEFTLALDFATHLPPAPIYLYHSQDDPEVPLAHLRVYARALPQATVRVLKDARHDFADGLFPELAEDIRGR